MNGYGAQGQVKRLRLHTGPAEAIGVAVNVLARLLPLNEVVLGGGTALEARWHHRVSTDLDFFSSGEAVDTLFYGGLEKMELVLTEAARSGEIDVDWPMVVRPNAPLKFFVGDTPVTIGRVHRIHGEVGLEVERTTGVKLAPTKDILTKKLFNRLWENGIVTERDAYDFAVASHRDLSALRYAWDQLDTIHQAQIKTIYQRLAGQERHPSDETSLRNAAFGRLAQNLWVEVHRMFAGNLSHRPPLKERPRGFCR